MTTILAPGQGTSSTKALVVDPGEGVLAIAEEPVRPDFLEAGGVEQDPQQLLDSLLARSQRALRESGRTADVVALANLGGTVLAWDPGTGLSMAAGWQDRRADGGLTRCHTLRQATADMMQLPGEIYRSPRATPLGAAALGRMSIEPALDLPGAIMDWAPPALYEPRWRADQANEYRGRWRAAITASLPGGSA